MTDAIPPLTAQVTVDADPAAAFDAFTTGFDAWWPVEFTWSQADHLDHMAFGEGVDGLLSEYGPHGFRIDWGRVIAWDPPSHLAFTWQIGPDRVPVPDPGRASTVDVTFAPADGGATEVAVVHDRWAAHGEGAAAYRDAFEPAWPMALAALARHLAAG